MKKTILLVDDEINILDIQNRYLIQAGYDVLVAHDGKEGLELFRKKSIDLIITDIMMPNMDGYDFISEVQYIAPNQPFLFTTAKTSEQDKIYGLSLGADDFIVKPFSPRELVLRVNNILRRLSRGGEIEQIEFGDLVINHVTHEVRLGEQPLNFYGYWPAILRESFQRRNFTRRYGKRTMWMIPIHSMFIFML